MDKESNQIVIYQDENGKSSVDVSLKDDTLWLDAHQMAILFNRERSVIVKHINNIYKTRELGKKSTCAKIAQVARDGKMRQMIIYNLDVIISVGYRVNSKQGTRFRIWATDILKQYLVRGFTLNEKKLKLERQKYRDLQESIKLLKSTVIAESLTVNQARELVHVINDFSYALDLLDGYDHQTLEIRNTSEKEVTKITYEEAIEVVGILKERFNGSSLAGIEKDESFKSSINAIYQTFGGKELYPSIEEKAANLLYFIIKNHSFIDGNKRIAALIFILFLERNRVLYKPDGSRRMADNALAALTLMVAQSKPEEKDIMIKVIVNLINKDN